MSDAGKANHRRAPKRLRNQMAEMEESAAVGNQVSMEVLETKEFYENLVGNAGDAILSTTPDGVVTSWNVGAEKLYGYSRGEVLGKDVRSLIVPTDRLHEVADLIAGVTAGKDVVRVETVRLRKDGSQVEVEITNSPVRDSHGKVIGVSSIHKDISKRKCLEQQIVEAKEYLESLIGSAGDAVVGIRMDGTIITWNTGAEDLFGFRKEETLGQNIRIIARDESLADMEEVIARVRSGAVVRGHEMARYRRDGTPVEISLTSSPMRDAEGHVTGLCAIYKDITARKRAEREVVETKEFLESLIATAGDAIICTGKDDLVTVWNAAAERLYEYTAKEVLGKSFLSLIVPEESRGEAKERLKPLDDGAIIEGYETRRMRKDGSLVWVSISNAPLFDKEGRRIGTISIHKDITERKKAEGKLEAVFAQVEKSHDDMMLILDNLRLGAAMVEEDGRVTFLSQQSQRVLGKSQEEVLGRHWERFFPLKKEDKGRLRRMIDLSPERRTKLSVDMEHSGGGHYWVDIEVQDDPRDPKRKMLFLYDMTDVRNLRNMLDKEAQFRNLVGKSEPMRAVYQQIRDVSQVDWTVLVEGETGTGKELVARAIHLSSQRKEKPFIAVNCAGLTDSLLASQLFGHRRGAFTGAVEDQQGFFEAANGGTLFLDEIGDVSQNVQTSLLRALEENEITRLGESRSRRIDVRIIAATHHDLGQEVEKGDFRADLFYRIRVARIKLPPLHERREDIPLLVRAFLSQCRAATGKPVQQVSDEAMRKLLKYRWPGNVRELRSAVEFAVIHCGGSVIEVEDLPPEIIDEAHVAPLVSGAKQDEKEIIMAALESAGGSRTVAARLLGISRATFYRRLAILNLEPPSKD